MDYGDVGYGGGDSDSGKDDWNPETFGFALKVVLGVLGTAILLGVLRDVFLR